MILLLDNYDSFVWNLARYVRELGGEPLVLRNDAVTPDDVAGLAPSHIIISPGPCTPSEAGVSLDVIRRLGIPTFYPTVLVPGSDFSPEPTGSLRSGRWPSPRSAKRPRPIAHA